jgi:hypothetical protein
MTVSKGLSGTLQGFMWAAGAISVLVALLSLGGLAAFNDYWDAPQSFQAMRDVADADNAINGACVLMLLVAIVVLVLIIVWSNKAHKASQSLARGTRTWTSGWTVGAWFIPVANWVIPKLVLNEIERIALAPRDETRLLAEWQGRPTIPIGWFWWLLFVPGWLIAGFGFNLFDALGGSAGSWRAGYIMLAVGALMLAASAVFGALYVRRISKALND